MTIIKIQKKWWVKTKVGAFSFNSLNEAIKYAIAFAKEHRGREITLSVL